MALHPAERLALDIGLRRVQRGEAVSPNVAATCIRALARVADLEPVDDETVIAWALQTAPDAAPYVPYPASEETGSRVVVERLIGANEGAWPTARAVPLYARRTQRRRLTDGEDTTIHVTDADAATLRDIAQEYGLTTARARRLLELGDEPGDDEMLRPRVAAIYRLVLDETR